MKKTLLIIFLLLLIFILSTCFFTGNTTVSVSPIIRAIGLPAKISSAELTVSGPGMNTIGVVYDSLPSTIELAVPTGTNRTFELIVYVDDPVSAATSFKGTATADLSQGNAEISLTMGLNSTKLVVPDAYNYRIVQIDDMSGTGWTSATWADLGFSNDWEFFPYDTDIDQHGNIYVANNYNTTLIGGIWRLTSINDTNPVLILYNSVSATPMKCVAVDRTNDRIYGVTASGIVYWSDYTGSSNLGTLFFTPSAETVSGIAIDNEGNVYLCGNEGNGGPWITKYTKDGGTAIASFIQGGPSYTVNDITILNDELYATLNNPTGVQIEKFDLNLNQLTSYGTSGSQGTKGEFVGPYNFVAVMNKKLTIIDSTGSPIGLPDAQLISMSDILGNGWENFGTWDTTFNEDNSDVFKFFYNC